MYRFFQAGAGRRNAGAAGVVAASPGVPTVGGASAAGSPSPTPPKKKARIRNRALKFGRPSEAAQNDKGAAGTAAPPPQQVISGSISVSHDDWDDFGRDFCALLPSF